MDGWMAGLSMVSEAFCGEAVAVVCAYDRARVCVYKTTHIAARRRRGKDRSENEPNHEMHRVRVAGRQHRNL